MKIKEKFTIEEEEILLAALDHLIDSSNHFSNMLNGDKETSFSLKRLKILDVRKKLKLEMYPITIDIQDDGLKHNWDKMYGYCYLCGMTTDLPFPEVPKMNEHFICQDCFKKYAPTLFEKTCENNKKYWEEDERKFHELNPEYLEKHNSVEPDLNDEEDGDLPF